METLKNTLCDCANRDTSAECTEGHGKEVHLHMHNVSGNNNVYICCPWGNKFDCKCNVCGNGDDDKPGTINISLLGSSGNETFFDLILLDEGYAALGKTDKATLPLVGGSTMLLATYNNQLGLTSQTHYPVVGSNYDRNNLLHQTIDGKRLVLAGSHYHIQEWAHRDTVLFDVDKVSKVALSQGLQLDSRAWFEPQNLVPTPLDFTGSASMICIGYPGYVMAIDNDMNLLKSVDISSGNECALQRTFVTRDKVLVCGNANGNFGGDTRAGFLVVMDDNLQAEAIHSWGYETKSVLCHIVQGKDGLVLAGQVNNRLHGKNDILLLSLDSNFKLIRQAMISAGNGNDQLTSVDVDALGNILLCGTTNSVGAGETDIFLLRLDPEFNVAKEMAFGSVAEETIPAALFNKYGGVTFVGGTNGSGAGNMDAFIATVSGNWQDLTGRLKKYPNLVINGKPGFRVDRNFTMQYTDKASLTVTSKSLIQTTPVLTVDTAPGFIVDPNASV